MMERCIKGVVFDKDGTLLDFHATWDVPFGAMIAGLAGGNSDLERRLADSLGLDLATRSITPGSPFVTESNVAFGNRVAAVIGRPPDDRDLLAEIAQAIADNAPEKPTAAPGAGALLAELAARGLPVALATNDAESRGRAQMEAMGWSGHFRSVYGYDSGHGEKPDPGMVLAAVRDMGLDPSNVVMVGDSHLDVTAGRAAGVITALVGGRADLVDEADIVLPALVDLLDHLS
jgi:phosphoglycolate phosphatase